MTAHETTPAPGLAGPAEPRIARVTAWLKARLASPELWIVVGLFVLTTVVVGLTADGIGFTRDEGYYFKAGRDYWGWFAEFGTRIARGDVFGAFSPAVIDKHWSYNHEHPVLVKTSFALSYGFLHRLTGIFAEGSDAFRFPAWLFSGLAVSLTYRLARCYMPRGWALFAALLFACQPRVFWHMHLACFDMPVIAAHLWLVLAYQKHRRTPLGIVWVGVAFGLAAATKHNVLPTPALFVLHWLLLEAKRGTMTARGWRLPRIPLVFFSLAIIGPIVFVAHWPYLWPSVIKRIGWYLGFHLNHEHYPIAYFGDLLTKPPFPVAFPLVMWGVTVPLPALVLIAAGAGLAGWVALRAVAERWADLPITEGTRVRFGQPGVPSADGALLLLLNMAFPVALIALPSSPIFGGTKHWMNALPFACILGAWALREAIARAAITLPALRMPGLVPAMLALAVLPGVVLTAHAHPSGLSSYNSVVGFERGAANAGFQRTFWGYEPREALPLLNEKLPRRGRLHFGDTNQPAYRQYKTDKLLRSDVQYFGGLKGAHGAAVQPQGEFKDQWLKALDAFGHQTPAHVVHIDGVPLGAVILKDPPPAP